MPKRQAKNTVAILRRGKGLLTLRWRYGGDRYQLATGLNSDAYDHVLAVQLAIQRDILGRTLDKSLARYKSGLSSHARAVGSSTEGEHSLGELIALWLDFRRSEGVAERTLQDTFFPAFKLLESLGRTPSQSDAKRLVRESITDSRSAYTVGRYLGLWKSFGRWAKSEGHWLENPFDDISAPKHRRDRTSKQPFTMVEIDRILTTCLSRPAWAFYHDLLKLMLLLGLRPGEAVELRWKDIDLTGERIWIGRQAQPARPRKEYGEQSPPRSKGKRQMQIKPPKADGEPGFLPLTPSALRILQARKPLTRKTDDLVFPAPKGGHIDTHNLNQRVFKQILESADIRWRSLNTARHTAGSIAIENGSTLPQTAKMLRHRNTRMVLEFYGHAIDPAKMPDF